MSFAKSVGRLTRTSCGVIVNHGSVHPPLAAHTSRTPRDWREEDAHAGEEDSPPLLLFCHATGFCKEVWGPVVEELTKFARAPFRWAALDFAGHGDSRPIPGEGPADWRSFGADVNGAVAQLRKDSNVVVGVGHSMGGAALLLSHLSGESFSRLVLFEPIVGLERHKGDFLSPLAQMALRRKASWESPLKVQEYLASRKAFSRFDPRALAALGVGGVRSSPDGTSLVLKCDPQAEARIYPGQDTTLFNRLPQVSVPCDVIVGEHSPAPLDHAHFQAVRAALNASSGDSPPIVAKGCGHFMVMEDPRFAARAIAASCSGLLPRLFPAAPSGLASKL